MARSVDNINLMIVVIDRGLLGGDSNTALVFLVTRVHNESLAHFGLIITEGIRLFQKCIHQRRFTVVNVRDDCNITDVFFIIHIALIFYSEYYTIFCLIF